MQLDTKTYTICPFLQSKKKRNEQTRICTRSTIFFLLSISPPTNCSIGITLIFSTLSSFFKANVLSFVSSAAHCSVRIKSEKKTNAEEFLPLRKMEKFRIFKRRTNRKKYIKYKTVHCTDKESPVDHLDFFLSIF